MCGAGDDSCRWFSVKRPGQNFPNLKRLVDEIAARPAAVIAAGLKDRHKFKTEYDDEARKIMFRHMDEKVA